jgi:hypothetical protein
MDSHIKSLLFEQESDILLDEGIHYIYSDDNYMDVDGNITPFVNGKVAYIVSRGMNVAYPVPLYLIKRYAWFNNALGESGFSSSKIELPTDNFILPVEAPYPKKLKLVYDKIMNGKTDYISSLDKVSVKETFDYFCIDISLD